MTKAKRFDYLKETQAEAQDTKSLEPKGEAQLTSVPKREGRMTQDREQLNVRIPTMLKRRAAAQAALEGRTIGDVVETLLLNYIREAASSDA